MLHAVLLSLLVADAVAMSTVHMMWSNEVIIAPGSTVSMDVREILGALDGHAEKNYDVAIDSVTVNSSVLTNTVWTFSPHCSDTVNLHTINVYGLDYRRSVPLREFLLSGNLCLRVKATVSVDVVLDLDVYLRFEPKSWAAPMTTPLISDTLLTSFTLDNEPMAWDVRGTFTVHTSSQARVDHYYALLRCTETGTVRFTLSPYSSSRFAVLDPHGVVHSFDFGTRYLNRNTFKDVPCVQGRKLFIYGSYSQGSVSWELTSSTPAPPTPAPHGLDPHSDPTSTQRGIPSVGREVDSSRDGVSIGAVVGIFFALGFVIVVAVVVGVVLYWYKFKRGVKAGPSNADLTLTDEEGCSVTGSGGGGGGTIRHSKGNSGDVRHGSGSRGDSRRGGSEGSSRGVGGGGKGGKGSKGSSGKDKDKTESPPAQELVTVEDVVPNVQE